MKYSQSSLIVGFKDRLFNVNKRDAAAFLNPFPGFKEVSYTFRDLNAVLVKLIPNKLEDFINESKKHDEIYYCEMNYGLKPCSYLDRVHPSYMKRESASDTIRRLHNLSPDYYAGIGVKIAMLDSGISPHPYLPATTFSELISQEENWYQILQPSKMVATYIKKLDAIEKGNSNPFILNNLTQNNVAKYYKNCRDILKDMEENIWREWSTIADDWFSRTRSFVDRPKIPFYHNYLGVLRRISIDSKNVIDNSLNVEDTNGHGTQMAGLITGRKPIEFFMESLSQGFFNYLKGKGKGKGKTNFDDETKCISAYEMDINGISPMSELLVIKCFDENVENGDLLSNLLIGLDYAEQKEANLIYVGWSFSKLQTYDVIPLSDKIRNLRNKNILVICPAGNDSKDKLSWPAAAPDSIAITSITNDSFSPDTFKISHHSNWADHSKKQAVTFSAYGGSTDSNSIDKDSFVMTTSVDFGFDMVVGTSVAAAIATGILARKLSELTVSEVDKIYHEELNKCVSAIELPSTRTPFNLNPSQISVENIIKYKINDALTPTQVGLNIPSEKFGWGVIRI